MTKQGWQQVAELVGIVAIVASLIFVGLQLKQAQDIAIGEQYQARAVLAVERIQWSNDEEALREQRVNYWSSAYESGELPDALVETYESYGPEYLTSSIMSATIGFVTLDNHYFQYQKGLMDEESWTSFRVQLKRLLGNDLNEWVFRELLAPQQRQSFATLCDELIAEHEVEENSTQ